MEKREPIIKITDGFKAGMAAGYGICELVFIIAALLYAGKDWPWAFFMLALAAFAYWKRCNYSD